MSTVIGKIEIQTRKLSSQELEEMGLSLTGEPIPFQIGNRRGTITIASLLIYADLIELDFDGQLID